MRAEQTFMKKAQQLFKKAGFQLSLENAELTALTDGGSDRKFYRIKEGDASYVVMASTTPRFDIESYISVGAFLFKHGIGVPRIYAHDDEKQVVLLEDLGDESLLQLLKKAAGAQEIKTYYKQVLTSLAEMQIKTKNSLDDCDYLRGRSFGYEAFRWETDYFTECFLKRFCGLAIENDEELDRELHLLAASLDSEPRYFMHRDFQSQNIYFKDGRPRFIDFQTATKGLLQYDAVSLLKDAYCKLEENLRDELLDFYLETLKSDWSMDIDRESFIRTFHRAGLQRNMQALGAFAYLAMDKGKTAFAAHIPNALFYLRDALKKFPEFPLLRELLEQSEIKTQSTKL
jgi:aminoglycoside/choline kinase family phosphotransferase